MKLTKNPDEELELSRPERIGGWIALIACSFPVVSTLVQVGFRLVGQTPTEYSLNVVCFIVNALIAAVVFHRTLLRGFKKLAEHPGRFLLAVAIGFAVYYGVSKLVNYLVSLAPQPVTNSNNNSVVSMLRDHPVMMTISVCLLAPFAEECLWRALVFGEVRQYNRPLAYVTTTLLFALLHVYQYIGEYTLLNLLLVTATYLPAGPAMSWVYDRTKSIWGPVLVHGAINGMVVMTIFLTHIFH